MPLTVIHKSSSNKKKTWSETGNSPFGSEGTGAAAVSVSQPFIDKISIVVKPASGEDAALIHDAVWTAFGDKSTFNLAGPLASNGYQAARFVEIKSSPARPLLQYRGSNKKAEKVRLEFNPRKLGETGLMELAACVMSMMPDGWEYVVQYGRVSRIDIAVDIVGVRMHDFLCLPLQGITSKVWSVDGHPQTITLGKKGNMTSIYNVKAKRLAK